MLQLVCILFHDLSLFFPTYPKIYSQSKWMILGYSYTKNLIICLLFRCCIKNVHVLYCKIPTHRFNHCYTKYHILLHIVNNVMFLLRLLCLHTFPHIDRKIGDMKMYVLNIYYVCCLALYMQNICRREQA